MSFANRAKEGPGRARPGIPCSVGALLESLPPDEAAGLRDILDAPWRVWPHVKVEEAIREEGHQVGDQQVGRHRRGRCGCGRADA